MKTMREIPDLYEVCTSSKNITLQLLSTYHKSSNEYIEPEQLEPIGSPVPFHFARRKAYWPSKGEDYFRDFHNAIRTSLRSGAIKTLNSLPLDEKIAFVRLDIWKEDSHFREGYNSEQSGLRYLQFYRIKAIEDL